ncbi:MAG: hypothetical protein LBB45_09445 [Methanobrevibacter sp.]|nr:hypothetical protein [Candidatus Methanovirga basalitermitum]
MKNIKISGDIVIDEVYLDMMRNKKYLVSIIIMMFDMPIAIANNGNS